MIEIFLRASSLLILFLIHFIPLNAVLAC